MSILLQQVQSQLLFYLLYEGMELQLQARNEMMEIPYQEMDETQCESMNTVVMEQLIITTNNEMMEIL